MKHYRGKPLAHCDSYSLHVANLQAKPASNHKNALTLSYSSKNKPLPSLTPKCSASFISPHSYRVKIAPSAKINVQRSIGVPLFEVRTVFFLQISALSTEYRGKSMEKFLEWQW
jgi:hypothetical protein